MADVAFWWPRNRMSFVDVWDTGISLKRIPGLFCFARIAIVAEVSSRWSLNRLLRATVRSVRVSICRIVISTFSMISTSCTVACTTIVTCRGHHRIGLVVVIVMPLTREIAMGVRSIARNMLIFLHGESTAVRRCVARAVPVISRKGADVQENLRW